jgi:hypothetical protein
VLEDRAVPTTFFVTSAVDAPGALVPGSLRWAVAQANLPQNQGSTVAITPLVQGAITLRAGELPIRSSLTIENDSGGPLTIRQATPGARIFHVFANARTTSVTIAGEGAGGNLTLTGGQALNANGGAILADNPLGDLSLSYVNVVLNTAIQLGASQRSVGGNGGGIYSRGAVALDHSSVSGNRAIGPNSATGQAGGVYTDRGLTAFASHIDGNSARDAGGLFNVTGNVFVLAGSTVDGNSSTGNAINSGDGGGGGIGEELGYVTVSDSQVAGNVAKGMYSAGIVSLMGGVSILARSQVDGNANNGPGGGIAANFLGPVIVNGFSEVDGNTGAGLGGGIVNFSERYGISVTGNSRVAGNILTNAETGGVIGGFLQAASSPAFLSPGRSDALLGTVLRQFVTVVNQRAAAIKSAASTMPDGGNVTVGGGIASALTGPIVVADEGQVYGNVSGAIVQSPLSLGIGGGIFANQGPITVDSGVVSANVASGSGGGIWSGQSLVVTNSQVIGNVAGAPGGGIFNRGSYVNSNGYVSGNTPDDVFPTV